ncbi:MAG: hypothetical protein AAGB34_11035 [Planctomycetota bacterium]
MSVREIRKLMGIGGVMAMLAGTSVSQTVLYDGAIDASVGDRGWLPLGDPFFGHAGSLTPITGGTRFDSSTNISDKFGLFSTIPSIGGGMETLDLDADTGFRLTFDLAIVSESHNRDERGGFSVIVVTNDTSRALEIAFQEDRLFAYESGSTFPVGDVVARDTSVRTEYALDVLGSSYTLSADSEIILVGDLRDYRDFSGSPDPYEEPGFLFFGDDTSSASSTADIFSITLGSIPAPTSAWLPGAMCLLLARRRLD